MNYSILDKNKLKKMKYKIDYISRYIGVKKIKTTFKKGDIEKIYIINLDRAEERWNELVKELDRIKLEDNKTLLSLSERFKAIDAKTDELDDYQKVEPIYYLHEQFQVEPCQNKDFEGKDMKIKMSKQEVAVSLSHIGVWEKMLNANLEYALILEDDIYFDKMFSYKIDKIWNEAKKKDFDILFLSFGYVKGVDKNSLNKEIVHNPEVGIWQASGYVLSKNGCKKLLSMLPLHGPVDLWFNLQFEKLNALMINNPLIKQRNTFESSNNYSIMPVLESLGIYSNQIPFTLNKREKLPLIYAFGNKNTSSLALALSMVGYSVCSNLKTKPENNFFNAFVNIEEVSLEDLKKAKIICTDKQSYQKYLEKGFKPLLLSNNNEWKELKSFLNITIEYIDYPKIEDSIINDYKIVKDQKYDRLQWDNLPWINKNNEGIKIESDQNYDNNLINLGEENGWVSDKIYFREDTFAGNLAIFKSNNIEITNNNLELNLDKDIREIKDYSSAALGFKQKTLYGKYSAILKPSNLNGVITGLFLYRSNPHQEIDIEFLGNNNYGFLTNVFYNPGVEGTHLEYGVRGTPIWVDLGFDVTKEYHKYEIEWSKYYISFKVDDKEVLRREVWNPSLIPDLPMEFNINLWNSNSKELVGELDDNELPTKAKIKSLSIKI